MRKQLDSAVKSVNDSNAQLRTQVGQLQTQVDVLVDSLKQLEQQSKNQQTAISRLQTRTSGQSDERLKEIEAAIQAFDAYRIQVNNRLDQLER